MRQRQAALFENDCFLNAIYLDSRVNVVLTFQQIEVAQTNLKNLHLRIVKLLSPAVAPPPLQLNEPQPSTSSENDIDSFLQRFDHRRSSDQGFYNNQSSTTQQVHLASNLAAF